MRQLRSQREAPLSSNKKTKSVKKKSKTDNISKTEEIIPIVDNKKNSNKLIEKDKEVPKKNCKKTDILEEGENDKPCPVLRKAMDDMLGMLSKCMENVKIIDSKWKKSKYSFEGNIKANHHIVKQLEALRNNFGILEDDLIENEETLKHVKKLVVEKEDADSIEEKMDSRNICLKENVSDNVQSPVKTVSEKDGKMTEKANEKNVNIDISEGAGFDLDRTAAGKFSNSVDHYENCIQDSSKAGLPYDEEHSLPDLINVIKEIISDSDEPMDGEEKMTMIKSLDMENEVPELLEDVTQKRKTEEKIDSKQTDLNDKEKTDNLSNTLITHSEDKETSNTRICKNRRLRSASGEFISDSDAEVGKRVRNSSQQHKKMKLDIECDDESNEGNKILNGTGKNSNKNKKVLDDDSEADRDKVNEDPDKNVDTQNLASNDCEDDEELVAGGISKTHRKLRTRTQRVESPGNNSKSESDIDISNKKRKRYSQRHKGRKTNGDTDEDDTEKDDNISIKGKDKGIKKSEKMESSKEGDDDKNNATKKPAIHSPVQSDDKETSKENLSKSQKKLKEQDKQKNKDDMEDDDRGTDASDKGPSEGNVTDNDTGKIKEHENSSEEEAASKKKKEKNKRKKKSTVNNDSENEEEEKKDIASIDKKDIDIKKEETSSCKLEIKSEDKIKKDKAVERKTVSRPGGAIKMKKDLKSEEDKNSLQCVTNGIDLDKEKDSDMESPSKSKDKNVPKKKKRHSIRTENQKAKVAILKSDSEDELEDKPKPRSKKKHYIKAQNRGKSHRKLKLKMTEKEIEELKGKQLDSKCQVLVETLSSEVSKKLEEEEFIYSSDYPDLRLPTLQRQVSNSDGCDADEEDSDKEFSKLMK